MAATQDSLRNLFKEGADSELLWGMLHIKIIRCKELRDMDASIWTREDRSDPYISVWLGDYTHRLAKTRALEDTLDPEFEEEYFCPVANITDGIRFNVKDIDPLKDANLGKYFLPAHELVRTVSEEDIEADDSLQPGDLKRVGIHKVVYLNGDEDSGSLEFFVEFVPVRMLGGTVAVPGVYFKETEGNAVRLYMNADDDGSSPEVTYGGDDDDEKVYKAHRLWGDIYWALSNARHFIYMAGWSIDVDQYLLRGEDLEEALEKGEYSPRIGDLLKQKSEEGVVVNIMQWDDATSTYGFPGMMATHDEKTREFFDDTKVNSVFCQIEGDVENTFLTSQQKKVGFTHHQKYVMVDCPRGGNPDRRQLMAYVGGIDLTSGRWDNRSHSLFRTLQSKHNGDVYNGCFNVSESSSNIGPREPWHDIHSGIVGPGVLQLIQAFSERWRKQAHGLEDELVDLSSLGLDDPETLVKHHGWHSQLSRSIDERINRFDPAVLGDFSSLTVDQMQFEWEDTDEPGVAMSRRFETVDDFELNFNRTLDYLEGRDVDTSIHKTNVHHIRRAKHFIYIESQYFMGSSFMWPDSEDRKIPCNNLLPAEITLKICEKIFKQEPFAVYILLPMWPEGIPDSPQIQELLYWERCTMEAMYQKIQQALDDRMSETGEEELKVTDYLNFYCIGTRESEDGNEATEDPCTDDEERLAATRRHQIYVHSKMMVVDDEVVLIGTANINQRSMDGCRDSEIMKTFWHPDDLATDESIAKGDVHGYRMHIWASIAGEMDDSFRNPSSLECVNRMNEIASNNWEVFIGEDTVDMESHLLPSPLEFSDGAMKPREGLEDGKFPDTNGDVLGAKSCFLPDNLTT